MCPLMMLVMFVVMAVVMLAWLHAGNRPWWGRRPTDPSLQILSERYARGEIHKDEYEEKKATILSAR
jgi:uncharacterized membrane protein